MQITEPMELSQPSIGNVCVAQLETTELRQPCDKLDRSVSDWNVVYLQEL